MRSSSSFRAFDEKAAAGAHLSVVFFGGSLTWGANASDPQRTSYRGRMEQYLQERYPHSSFGFHDAAIGGTGSTLGLFRLERDVLARKPDLVFLDFTANDDLTGSDMQTLTAYECILRELISRNIPVVQVFFAFRGNFARKYDPVSLTRYQAHMQLARAYGCAVGDSLPVIQQAVTSGGVDIQKLWPFDGSHPGDAGYELFFHAVRDGFEDAIKNANRCVIPDKPVFSDAYMNHRRMDVVLQSLPSGWHRVPTYRTSLWFDGLSSRWMGDVAACDFQDRLTVQPLEIPFQGTFVGILGESDQNTPRFRVFIDGRLLLCREKNQTRETWDVSTRRFGVGRLFYWKVLSNEIPPGSHVLRIEPVYAAEANAGQLRIASVCQAGPTQ